LPAVAEIVPQDVAPKLVFDPGHPDADERGMVSLPGVDPVTSMMDLIEISRSYEANLRAFDISRSLLQRTLELGRNR
jgi:flagellar basal-body rod protein FlgC